ncbi:MAG: flagellar basal-body rod protein FlgF [Beijerinckiaceae bacterium]
MQSGVYVGLSAKLALKQRMETLAHNVANMNTPGFRAEEIRFETLLAKSANTQISFSSAGDTYVSMAAGQMVQTGNKLDVAITGNGWMAIQTPEGRAYTRDGRFVMSATGALNTINGQAVLDVGGAPIQLDPNGPAPVIAKDGMITQGGAQMGAIGLFAMDPAAKLTRAPGSAVRPDREPAPIVDFVRTGLAQGVIENANVNPVMEMSRLIAVQRLFESVSAGIDAAEASMTDSIRTLGSSTS